MGRIVKNLSDLVVRAKLFFSYHVFLVFSALMYSIFGVIVSWGRGVDDELNTLTAATATGLLYKSSGMPLVYLE